MQRWPMRLAVGAVAGLVATAPMTLTMLALHRFLPRRERYALPPREITETVMAEVGLAELTPDPAITAATLVAHFGFGAAAGAPYALLAPRPTVVSGTAYGVFVWLAVYLGIMPGLEILRPATEHPARRNALMIGAHLVWGSALALLTRAGARQVAPSGGYDGRPEAPRWSDRAKKRPAEPSRP